VLSDIISIRLADGQPFAIFRLLSDLPVKGASGPGGEFRLYPSSRSSQEAVMLLMTIAAKSLSSVSAGATRVAAAGFGGIAQLVRALIHRREILRLAELDERSLKDVGLLRSDVAGALAAPWFSDPSAVLAARSRAQTGAAADRRDHAVRHARTKLVRAKTDIAVARCA
jgi:uncharacterized protein YjiS (DUF1127 family)